MRTWWKQRRRQVPNVDKRKSGSSSEFDTSLPRHYFHSQSLAQEDPLTSPPANVYQHQLHHKLKPPPSTSSLFAVKDPITLEQTKTTRKKMEKKRTREAKKKTQIAIPCGGGIGGLVVVGGALAIAGLVAAFTFNRRRRNANNNISTKLTDDASKDPIKTEDQPNQGQDLLHTSTNSSDSVSIQCLILDEKPTTETDGQERISDILVTASGDSEKERILVGDDSGVPIDKICLEEDPIPLKTTQGEKKEDESFPTPALAVEEKQENDNGECIVEKANESSEVKGDSTIELNTGAIIEDAVKLEAAKQVERMAEEQELKIMKTGEHVHLNGSGNDNVFNDDHHPNENGSRQESKTKILWHTNQSPAINKLTVNSSKLRIWVLSIFMLVLLLLSFSFTPHKAVSLVLSLFSGFQSTVINRSS